VISRDDSNNLVIIFTKSTVTYFLCISAGVFVYFLNIDQLISRLTRISANGTIKVCNIPARQVTEQKVRIIDTPTKE
jgi:hypothetical protein